MFRVYLIISYVVSLILAGYICFKYLFPMLGRWIVDLCNKLEAANKKMEQEIRDLKKQKAQRREDDQCVIDGLYMDENDIEAAYKGTEVDPHSVSWDDLKKRSDS